MIVKAKPFQKKYDDDTYIDDINREVDKLNSLIDIYNSVPYSEKAEALLQVHQQLLKIDANIGGMGTVAAIAIGDFPYSEFYENLSNQIRTEFTTLGCPGFSAKQINQWDIENCKKNESIPSALLFEKETQPGFFARIFGAKTSTPISKATRLLSEIDPRTINENTEVNYYQLSSLKQSIRELITSEVISTSDKATLNNLIAKVNNRLSNILENNPQLRSKIYPPQVGNLAQSISNLSYENAQKVTNVLSKPDRFNAEEFHKEFDSIIPGLENYEIKFLGGVNAKNYLIRDIETGQQQVLKITPNKGNSRKAYERLKVTSVKDGITEIYATQQAIQGQDNYMYSLELTEFCAKGDVLSHGLKIQGKIALIEKDIAGKSEELDPIALQKIYDEFGLGDQTEVSLEEKQHILTELKEAQLLNTVNIYGQMTDILLSFQANNAFFPDAKPTNFLVNEFDQVLIADTKTFVDTVNGTVEPDQIKKNGLLQYSLGFRSPQFESMEPFSADKEHAYIMGISLYCYITGTDIDEVPRNSKDHPAFMKLDQEVFQSAKGQKFKELIEGLTQPDPDQRLSMHQAKEALQTIAHGIKVEKSPFKSKTEAYFFALHNLMEIAKTTENKESINQAIQEMKILIENHEQNPKVAASILTSLAPKLGNEKHQKLLHNIASAIENSTYQQTLQEKYENPLARRFESEMQIALLKNPTDEMMKSVGHVSQALLNVFHQMKEQGYEDFLNQFAENLTSGKEQTGFGSQPTPITIDKVEEILQKNDPKDLNQIMYIQFLFAQKWMRQLPESVLPPNRNAPTGKMLELVKEYNNGEYRDNPKAFFDNFDSMKLKFISDNQMYGSELFTADPTRGRQGPLQRVFSSQMGVMLVGQNQEGLDTDRSNWTPDAKYQGANLDSPFTRDLIENDAVYAAGPSGMTSLFMGIMENYGNFTSVEAKQNYLAAVSAYMVSGGLHSLHEVLGPAHYTLDLIPGYQISPPKIDSVASPPNFHQFYQQQIKLDPQFEERYKKGWDNVMEAYAKQKDQFIHAPISDISIVQQRVFNTDNTSQKENKYKNMSEEKMKEILQNSPELNAVKVEGSLTSTNVGWRRENKENYIKQNLVKINCQYLKGDQEKLDEAINLLFKTVCKTRTNIFKSYSTSTTSATNLINMISQDDKLRKVFGIQGDNPVDWAKEIKVKMEAACKNETIAAPDFSVGPDLK
ncbi:TPA: serine/threonine protein kinase [Legionella pneumophila]|nr:serine/threonine protein kinase [Legionella pneumophila]